MDHKSYAFLIISINSSWSTSASPFRSAISIIFLISPGFVWPGINSDAIFFKFSTLIDPESSWSNSLKALFISSYGFLSDYITTVKIFTPYYLLSNQSYKLLKFNSTRAVLIDSAHQLVDLLFLHVESQSLQNIPQFIQIYAPRTVLIKEIKSRLNFLYLLSSHFDGLPYLSSVSLVPFPINLHILYKLIIG